MFRKESDMGYNDDDRDDGFDDDDDLFYDP
jgi:hypothetical protein